MNIVGVDPSLTATGLAAIDLDARRIDAWKCIRTKPIDDGLKTHDLVRRLAELSAEVRAFCREFPGLVVIEGQVGASMGRAGMSSVFKLGVAYGCVIGALPGKPLVVMPAQVKKRLTGQMDASKLDCWVKAYAQLDGGPTPPNPAGGAASIEAVRDAVAVAMSALPEIRQLQQLAGQMA